MEFVGKKIDGKMEGQAFKVDRFVNNCMGVTVRFDRFGSGEMGIVTDKTRRCTPQPPAPSQQHTRVPPKPKR
ncbi:hypothetical protein M8J77_019904 [Diaphorina citri]|nr:hypothetical protein M8J77_019904 [Diaphorina citri]